ALLDLRGCLPRLSSPPSGPRDLTAAPVCEKQPSVPTPYAMFLMGLNASGWWAMPPCQVGQVRFMPSPRSARASGLYNCTSSLGLYSIGLPVFGSIPFVQFRSLTYFSALMNLPLVRSRV